MLKLNKIIIIALFLIIFFKYDFITIISQDSLIIINHLKYTLFNTLLGIGIGYLIAIYLGFIRYSFPLSSNLIIFLNIIIQNIPIVILLPILMQIFGIIEISKIVIISLIVMYPIYINLTQDKVKTEQIDFLLFIKTLTKSKATQYFELYLPYQAKTILEGLKISVTYAFYTTITTEFLVAQNGIGIYLKQSLNTFNYDKLYLITCLVIVISLGLVYFVNVIERKIFKYEKVK